MRKALVIEDDEAIRANVVELLTEEGFIVVEADNGRSGLELALAERPSLVICDIRMPELDGFRVLEGLRASPSTRATPFIFLSAAADRSDIRTGMTLGADDYVTKPFTRTELLDAIRTRLERTQVLAASAEPTPVPESTKKEKRRDAPSLADTIVVVAPAMRALYDDAAKAAVAPISILVLGETGVGKEVLAQSIHRISPRREAPFLALNCAALSETLLESELFGSERGAFTGSVAMRPGLFESAQGGTVFLDEVGELPMVIQVKLLRVLEERRVMRVGGRTPISVDVRFIAATNRDLEASIAQGTFREDLFYRLAGITLLIPPLREREGEIVPLALKFARSAALKLDRDGEVGISDEAREILAGYRWPGNVRELKNVMERAIVLATTNQIEVQHLPVKISGASERDSAPPSDRDFPVSSRSLRGEMVDLERKRIIEALEKCGGNQTAAAELLGMSRRTLVSRLSQYELPRPRKRG
ncbi:MAG TPA: sigma-54 dependent transcriptional regulator [Polyangiaceae bacterium]|nr:sigma-54 dependent transcriptional regulator [Polyangiaceae bacterium]